MPGPVPRPSLWRNFRAGQRRHDLTRLSRRPPMSPILGFRLRAGATYGVALIARASQRQMANVAQHGGICAVMVGATSLRKSELGMKFDAEALRAAAT